MMNKKIIKKSLICWLVLAPFIFLSLFPFAVMLASSLKPRGEVYKIPTSWLSSEFRFKNYLEMWDAIKEHWECESIPGFGDWSNIIQELDPFRDGKAAQRMGNYLNGLMLGFEKGLDKEEIMSVAAERYKKEWGDDKVIMGIN